MISEGRTQLQLATWLVTGPGMALFVVILIVDLFADASQEILAVSADSSPSQDEAGTEQSLRSVVGQKGVEQ